MKMPKHVEELRKIFYATRQAFALGGASCEEYNQAACDYEAAYNAAKKRLTEEATSKDSCSCGGAAVTLTPESLAELRSVANSKCNVPHYAVLALLDEIDRLRDELLFQQRLRIPCECSADDACKFARSRDEATAEVERLRAVIRETHDIYCSDAYTDRGMHAPECRLYEIEP
jgi:hypothetical protein